MPSKPKTVSEKVDRLDEKVGQLDKQVGRLDKQVGKLTKSVTALEVKASVLQQDVAVLKQDLSDLKTQFAVMDERQQNFEKLYHAQVAKEDKEREENRKFRDHIYTIADRMVKMFEEFTIEKLALGAKQDRLDTKQGQLEREVEALQDFDDTHSAALANLETRVAYLEAKAQ